MSITLGSITLPNGLRWSDEFAWSPVAQSTEFGLTGALIIQEGARQNGRPITLVGGINFAWLTRSALLALQTALDAATGPLTLTLHDNRTYQVYPRRDGDGPVSASLVPLVLDSGPADPSAATYYALNELRLMTRS